MIITDQLQWHHLPKTAGTSTDHLFELSGLPLLWRDEQGSPDKHLPAADRRQVAALLIDSRINVLNIRRLPLWLLSNYQHKHTFMGLDLPFEHVRAGMFYRHHQEEWLPADWWMERFAVREDWEFLRVEQLKADFLHLLGRYQPIGVRARIAIALSGSRNRNRYRKDPRTWFGAEDLRAVYGRNPLWARIEQRIYGNLLIY
jgi:hypothetical protein